MSQPPSASSLSQSWDRVAGGYEGYFGPRFEPWLRDAARELGPASSLPGGPIVVPCCGPGVELGLLADAHPGRAVVGGDFSAGMVARARERTASRPQVAVEHVDASTAFWSTPAAGLVSAFGLQQMPDPAATLGSWVEGLAPGGRLSVMLWPPSGLTESEGPFRLSSEAAEDLIGARPAAWFDELCEALEAMPVRWSFRGPVAHAMEHPSAEVFFEALVTAGSWAAMAARVGDRTMELLRALYLARSPPGVLRHRPRAWHLVGRRRGGGRGGAGQSSSGSKSALVAPHSGHTHDADRSGKAVSGAMSLAGSPSRGS